MPGTAWINKPATEPDTHRIRPGRRPRNPQNPVKFNSVNQRGDDIMPGTGGGLALPSRSGSPVIFPVDVDADGCSTGEPPRAESAKADRVPVDLEVESHVATITLDDPETRNALDTESARWVLEICDAIERDLEVGAVVVRGAGGTFCSGGRVIS